MAIEPYIEAPTIRTTEQPASGGIDTSAYDHLLQGVSVNKSKKQVKGVLPKIGAGTEDHQIAQFNFGQPKDFEENTQFDDTQQKVDPQKYLEDPTQFDPNTVGENFSLDGAIEPLTIRDVASFESIESPFTAHSVKGALMHGNEDIVHRTDVMQQFIPLPRIAPTAVEPYEDSDDHFGVELTGSVSLPGFLTDIVRVTHAFDDSRIHTASLVENGDSFDENGNLLSINAAILAMTGTVEDDMRPIDHKSAAAGFTYDNNPAGTDSLAFGGLDRTT